MAVAAEAIKSIFFRNGSKQEDLTWAEKVERGFAPPSQCMSGDEYRETRPEAAARIENSLHIFLSGLETDTDT